MADDALFIGWGEVVRGREHQALEVFDETVAFWQQAAGGPGRAASSRACSSRTAAGSPASCWCAATARSSTRSREREFQR